MDEATGADSLGKDERAELLRLREEVATLRGQAAGAAAGVPAEPVSRPRPFDASATGEASTH